MFVIAVDGPAGAGKSTICSQVCKDLGITYMNTGAIYRGISYLAKKSGIDLKDENKLVALTQQHADEFRWEHSSGFLFLGRENLSPFLYTEEMSRSASFIAKHGKLRTSLLPIQREIAQSAPKAALLDGRDIGTVVFPHAHLKIFMTASLEERAQRRTRQLGQNNENLERVIEDIQKRDHQDSQRDVAPLTQAHDAIIFDTSRLSVEEAIEALKSLIRSHLPL